MRAVGQTRFAVLLSSFVFCLGVEAKAADLGTVDMSAPMPINLAAATPSIEPPQPAPSETEAPVANVASYFEHWFDRVNQAQASQPHWMTPLVTVTPRLEQEVRYDQYWETRSGSSVDTYGSGKGLELIPTTTNEVLLNPPAYQFIGNTKKPTNGWVDDQFLVVKQRLLSANEDSGNYILTAFLGVTAPTGNARYTNDAWIITPTIAGGMGWGDFDIQATVGFGLATANQSAIGDSMVTNVALQYHAFEYFWPEFEVNDTYWFDGVQRGGKNQIFLTPGLILGRFALSERVKAIVGAGYQFAVSPTFTETSVQTPAYNHAWIMTARLAF